eukprot:276949-Pelagomonas_calceolata.AAC.2
MNFERAQQGARGKRHGMAESRTCHGHCRALMPDLNHCRTCHWALHGMSLQGLAGLDASDLKSVQALGQVMLKMLMTASRQLGCILIRPSSESSTLLNGKACQSQPGTLTATVSCNPVTL